MGKATSTLKMRLDGTPPDVKKQVTWLACSVLVARVIFVVIGYTLWCSISPFFLFHLKFEKPKTVGNAELTRAQKPKGNALAPCKSVCTTYSR